MSSRLGSLFSFSTSLVPNKSLHSSIHQSAGVDFCGWYFPSSCLGSSLGMLKLYLTHRKPHCPIFQCQAMQCWNGYTEAGPKVLTVLHYPEEQGHSAQQHIDAATPPETLQPCFLQDQCAARSVLGFSRIIQKAPRSSQIFSSQWL